MRDGTVYETATYSDLIHNDEEFCRMMMERQQVLSYDKVLSLERNMRKPVSDQKTMPKVTPTKSMEQNVLANAWM